MGEMIGIRGKDIEEHKPHLNLTESQRNLLSDRQNHVADTTNFTLAFWE